MQFHQLTYFVAAAEAASISRAAEKLRISQPAVSRQIALLESELGADLFWREKQRIAFTTAGRFFLPKARKLLADAVLAAQQTGETFGSRRQTIKVGSIGPVIDDLVAPAIGKICKMHPRCKVTLFDLHPSAQLELLAKGELDLAVLGNIGPADRKRFRLRIASKSPLAAVVPESHPLAKCVSIALRRLAALPIVSLSDALFPGRRQFLDDCCRAAGFTPCSVEEVDSPTLMFARIANGHAAGIAPSHAAKLPHAGCVFVPISTPAVYAELYCVLPKKQKNEDADKIASAIVERGADKLLFEKSRT